MADAENDDKRSAIIKEEEDVVASVAVSASVNSCGGAGSNSPKRGQKAKGTSHASSRKGRAPAVKGLTIPFRTVKKVSLIFL